MNIKRILVIFAAVVFAISAVSGSVWCLMQSKVVVTGTEFPANCNDLDLFLVNSTAQRNDATSENTLYKGVVIWTRSVKTGPVDFMSHDIWEAKIYVGDGKIEEVTVSDSGGAWTMPERVEVGDYVAVTKPLNIYNEYDGDAILVVVGNAMQIS